LIHADVDFKNRADGSSLISVEASCTVRDHRRFATEGR
jgi:hypothetical protein